MKSNVVIFGILTAYFVIVGGAYIAWNLITHGYLEWVGAVVILLSGGLTAFIAVYLWLVQKKQGGVLVEDIDDSDIDDGDPELGEFSPWSWWPIVLAGAAAVGMIALAVGVFLFPVALAIFVVAIVGWVYEYYRGYFAR